MDCVILLVSYLFVNMIPTFGENIYMTNSDCDTKYNMDTYKTVTLEYHGSDILYSNPCSVEFTKSSYDQVLCVSAQKVILDCETKLEYYDYLEKAYIEYIDPEKSISCTDTTVEDWCPDKYESEIFIVIRNPVRASSDYVKLQVYLKNLPDDDYSYSSSSSLLLFVIVPIVFLIVVIPLIIWRIAARRTAAARRPQVVYQTTSAAVNMQTGRVGYQEPQGSRSTTPFIQGDYHVHPVQSAYPVTARQQGFNTQSYQSAPPTDSCTAPPPSYESVVGKRT